MRLTRVGIVAGLVAAGSLSCNRPGLDARFACTQVAVAGVTVTVVDSATGGPKLFTGLWARARTGSYVDSLGLDLGDVQKGAITMSLAYEHKGTYQVDVHADGYQLWTKSDVVVTGDQCHVTTVALTARLVP